jgi:hypothetical protein
MPRYPREHSPKLSRYSRTFARLLFQRFPQWKELAGTYSVGAPGLQETLLEVRVPSANPQVATPVTIQTTANPQEVVIYWMDGWHRHHIRWGDQSEATHLLEVVEIIGRLVSEQDLVYYVYRDEHGSRGGTVAHGAETPQWAIPNAGERLVIRSWLGTYDQERPGP